MTIVYPKCTIIHLLVNTQHLESSKRRRQHIQEIAKYLKNDSGIGCMKCCLWLLKVCTFKGYVTKLLDSCQPFVFTEQLTIETRFLESTPMVDVDRNTLLSLPPFIKCVPDTKNTGSQGNMISLKMMINHHFFYKLCQLCLFRFFSGHNWASEPLSTRNTSLLRCAHTCLAKTCLKRKQKSSRNSGEIPQIEKLPSIN